MNPREKDYSDYIICFEFLALLVVIVAVMIFWYYLIYPPEIEYKEIDNLRCANINAIGCTTPQDNNTYLIEYVSNNQRCYNEGCHSIDDTLKHEMRHVRQHALFGTMWE